SGHFHFVDDTGRHPNCALRRYDPAPLGRMDGDDALGAVDQLMPAVAMVRDYVSAGKAGIKRPDLNAVPAIGATEALLHYAHLCHSSAGLSLVQRLVSLLRTMNWVIIGRAPFVTQSR